jgi:hypothetical protein
MVTGFFGPLAAPRLPTPEVEGLFVGGDISENDLISAVVSRVLILWQPTKPLKPTRTQQEI